MKFDLRGHLYRIFGVDLTEVPGLNALTAHTLLTEVGPDLSAFPNVGPSLRGWGYARTTASAAASSFRTPARCQQPRGKGAAHGRAVIASKPIILGRAPRQLFLPIATTIFAG